MGQPTAMKMQYPEQSGSKPGELMTKFGYGKFAVEPENIVKAVDWVLAHPKHKDLDEERINPCAEILKNF